MLEERKKKQAKIKKLTKLQKFKKDYGMTPLQFSRKHREENYNICTFTDPEIEESYQRALKAIKKSRCKIKVKK